MVDHGEARIYCVWESVILIFALSGEPEMDMDLFGCVALSCTIRFLNLAVFHWIPPID